MTRARTPADSTAPPVVRTVGDRAYRQAIGSLDEPGRSWVGSLAVDF